MLKRVRHFGLVALAVVLVLAVLPRAVSYADSGCAATITPGSVTTTSTTTFTVTITNNGTTDIHWIDIQSPSGIRYGGNYIYDWAAGDREDGTTLTGNTLSQGQTANFEVIGTAGLRTGSSNRWHVHVSDDSGGGNPIECTGSLSTVISGHPPTNAPTGVSNVMVTGITASSAIITWDSDSATTAIVYYGKTVGYGSVSGYNPSVDTSHSVTLSGLSSGTTYHFQAAGDDGGGGFAYSGDNTFVTAAAPSGGGGTSGGGSGAVTTPTGKPTESEPPKIELTTKLARAYKSPPVVSGTASDNDAVAAVEYSIDGGKNWVAADKVTPKTKTTGRGRNKKTTTDSTNVTFEFTPVVIEDGNYEVVARAKDPSGNIAKSAMLTLVIDRLPPRLGSEVIAFGNQAAQPDAAGRWQAVVGHDQTITVNAVGGPVSVVLAATRAGQARSGQSFTLQRDATSGLWSGVVAFQAAGEFSLTAETVDGAGNETRSTLADVMVQPPARVVTREGRPIGNVNVTLYYRQPQSDSWVVWDGAPYGQKNPQRTQDNGEFRLLVPAGMYYLKVESETHKTVVTRQFKLTRATPLSATIGLQSRPMLNLVFMKLYLPWVSLQQIDLGLKATATKDHAMKGKTLPNFTLPMTDGGTMTAVGLLGKPTVVTVASTWGPSTIEQLPALDELRKNQDVNVRPLVIGERVSKVQAYLARGGYDAPMMVDADATLSTALGVPSLPTHYILDRRGRVKEVLTGVQTKHQLLDAISR